MGVISAYSGKYSSRTAPTGTTDVLRPVRENLRRVVDCGTIALGAEVYASKTERKIVFHTCISRCVRVADKGQPKRGRRWTPFLPYVPYVGITLTMPAEFRPIFQQNKYLLQDTPAVGANRSCNGRKPDTGSFGCCCAADIWRFSPLQHVAPGLCTALKQVRCRGLERQNQFLCTGQISTPGPGQHA